MLGLGAILFLTHKWIMSTVLSAPDVARYILGVTPRDIAVSKLQSLLYFCQAWHLVWEGEPLFEDEVMAWSGGARIDSIHSNFAGRSMVAVTEPVVVPGMSLAQRESIDGVLADMMGLRASQLSYLVCSEKPWKEAYHVDGGVPISTSRIRECYVDLSESSDAVCLDELEWPVWLS